MLRRQSVLRKLLVPVRVPGHVSCRRQLLLPVEWRLPQVLQAAAAPTTSSATTTTGAAGPSATASASTCSP